MNLYRMKFPTKKMTLAQWENWRRIYWSLRGSKGSQAVHRERRLREAALRSPNPYVRIDAIMEQRAERSAN